MEGRGILFSVFEVIANVHKFLQESCQTLEISSRASAQDPVDGVTNKVQDNPRDLKGHLEMAAVTFRVVHPSSVAARDYSLLEVEILQTHERALAPTCASLCTASQRLAAVTIHSIGMR
jgi:hypothetical protein